MTDTKPKFPGGDNELIERLNSISVGKKNKINIVIFFRVNCKGEAMDFRLIKEAKAESFEKQVFRVVSEQKTWLPAKQGPTIVNSCYTLNIEVKHGKFKIVYKDSGIYLRWDDPRYKSNL